MLLDICFTILFYNSTMHIAATNNWKTKCMECYIQRHNKSAITYNTIWKRISLISTFSYDYDVSENKLFDTNGILIFVEIVTIHY